VDADDLDPDPLVSLQSWVQEAEASSTAPQAMTLATATGDGRPSARVLLLRGIDERGLTFFTNRGSRKSEELGENPRAALVLHWWDLGRQARVEGSVEEVSVAESEVYWRSRPRASRIAAWASSQSRPVESRDELEAAYARAEQRYEGGDVPLPPFWGGYRVVPDIVEFWTHRENRLHDRIRYMRSDDGWRWERLAP
jgi:pyridoxamine 5'-phosphate oxidase